MSDESKRQPTPDELEANADALLAKYAKGELKEGETTVDELDGVAEMPASDLGITDEEPESGKKKAGGEETDEEKDKREAKEKADKDAAATAASGEEPGTTVAGDPDAGEGKDQPGGEDEAFNTEGLSKHDAERVKNAQRYMHNRSEEAARLQRENDELRTRLAAPATVPVADPVVAEPIVAMDEAERARLKEAFPDLEKMIDQVGTLQRENVELRAQVGGVTGEVQRGQARTSKSDFLNTIRATHKDIDDIQKSTDFIGWVERKPEYVQQAVFGKASAEDIVTIVSEYKNDVGIPITGEEPAGDATADDPDTSTPEEKAKADRLTRAREAASPSVADAAREHKPGSGKGKTISRGEIEAKRQRIHQMTPDEQQAFEDEVDLAMVEGRITD